MKIDDLLDKYFEGETSAAEEKEIRAFFAAGEVPPHLSAYKPLFAYMDEEIAITPKRHSPTLQRKSTVLYLLSGVAAAILLLFCVRSVYTSYETRFCSKNYVVINGRCYTDIHKVRNMAFEALKEVATPANEYFPDNSQEALEKEMIEMQLKELGTLFNEE